MKNRHARHLMAAALCAVALPTLTSCVDDYTEQEETRVAGDTPITLNLAIETKAMLDDVRHYEEGDEYENRIDIAGGDYRIYFFDSQNKYIARFEPKVFTVTSSEDYTRYDVSGEAPAKLINGDGDFKVVMLANWGNTYQDKKLIPGKTNIDNICEAEWAKYTNPEEFTPGSGKLIPFYGVHEYSGVKFKAGSSTALPSPVTLLRAVAKVEVVLHDEYSGFSQVVLCRYNEQGYCAPKGVYVQKDYDHNSTWTSDYVKDLHLVGGGNDQDNEGKQLLFHKTHDRSPENEELETWVAYVPEYSNKKDKDDYCYIEVTLRETPYRIYFGDYKNDVFAAYGGDNPQLESRYDIQRNNLYRFDVTLKDQLLNVSVDKWDDEVYDNAFTFGKE